MDLNIKYRLINLYRLFNPSGGISQKDYFINQIRLIKLALHELGGREPLILGDFNLDENKKYNIDYFHKLQKTSIDVIYIRQLEIKIAMTSFGYDTIKFQ